MIQKKNCKLCHITLILFIILIIVFIIKYVLVKLENYKNFNQQDLIYKFYKQAKKYRIDEDIMELSRHKFEEKYNNYIKSKRELDNISKKLKQI